MLRRRWAVPALAPSSPIFPPPLPPVMAASLASLRLLHPQRTVSRLTLFAPCTSLSASTQCPFLPLPWNQNQRPARLCFAAKVSRDEQKDLLAGVHKDHVESIVRILEQANLAIERWEVTHSDFLTPPAISDGLRVLKRLSDIGVAVSGGYRQAERCRLSFGHKEALGDIKDNVGYPGAVAALSIMGDFMFDPPNHGDFLGSILGTGIEREKVGDILVQGDMGAQVIIVPELRDHLISTLTQVGKTPVLCKVIPLEDIQYRPPRIQLIKSVEASLRVDALASAGFKMSRSKLVDLISSGDVRVNWKEITKNGLTVKTGDIISIHHKGRLEIGEIHTTRKGKYAVELLRYL